jgi:hypothetical protein
MMTLFHMKEARRDLREATQSLLHAAWLMLAARLPPDLREVTISAYDPHKHDLKLRTMSDGRTMIAVVPSSNRRDRIQ